MTKARIRAIVAVQGLLVMASLPAFGGAHTWDVHEIFSNPSGTIQFIELREMNGGNAETGVVSNHLTSNSHSQTIGGTVTGTSFKTLLFGTPAFASMPGVPPLDRTIPPNFFSISGDTITYSPYDSFTFLVGDLPTDGTNSLSKNDSTLVWEETVNSPKNYAGTPGSIVVTGPPAVPDRAPGTQMKAQKLDSAAFSISVNWDTASCSGANLHHLIYGQGSQLPTSPAGLFGVMGSECGLGATSPFTWTSTPTASDGTGLIWWLIVVRDVSGAEGSWGRKSSWDERNGPGANGSSGQCAVTTKNISNSCGQ